MGLQVETAKNVLGDDTHFFTPWPSDADSQNCHLDTKYRTRDCDSCRCFIPREGAFEIIKMATDATPYRWTPPEEISVRGVCNWGKCLKVLVDRPKGIRHCALIKK